MWKGPCISWPGKSGTKKRRNINPLQQQSKCSNRPNTGNIIIMPLIQLNPHTFSSLPAHPSLPSDPSRPELGEFLRNALGEALELLDTTIPSTLTTDPKLRSSPPSEAKVKLLRGWRKPQPLAQEHAKQDAKEFWVCRHSKHLDSSKKGTASWREFEAGLRIDHAEHEMEYTPSVTGLERLLEWSDQQELREGIEVAGVRYKDVTVEGKYNSLL